MREKMLADIKSVTPWFQFIHAPETTDEQSEINNSNEIEPGDQDQRRDSADSGADVISETDDAAASASSTNETHDGFSSQETNRDATIAIDSPPSYDDVIEQEGLPPSYEEVVSG